MGPWLSFARKRLAVAEFVVSDNATENGTTFPVVARRTRFEWTKFGYAETFFVFKECDHLTITEARDFSAAAFRFAKRHKTIFLPCGLLRVCSVMLSRLRWR